MNLPFIPFRIGLTSGQGSAVNNSSNDIEKPVQEVLPVETGGQEPEKVPKSKGGRLDGSGTGGEQNRASPPPRGEALSPQETEDRLRQAQEELQREKARRRRVEEALKESETRFRFLTQTTGDALYQLRYRTMTYDYMSPGILNLIGYSPVEINRIGFATLVHKIELQGGTAFSREDLVEMRKAGQTGEYRADYLVKTSWGELKWLGDHSFPWLDQEGKVIGSVGILTDISERRQAQEEREELIAELRKTQEDLRRLSLIDSLTGLANRRHFDETFLREWRRSIRQDQPLGLILMDIDHFKAFNDNYGHQAGDKCLKKVSQAFQESLLRPGDFAARYGGEEFVAILPETSLWAASQVAEKIHETVAGLKIPHREGLREGVVTVSLGVASSEGGAYIGPEGLLSAADQACYLAKQEGRDMVMTSGEG